MTADVASLIAAINDNPDLAHGDLTPAVHALVRLGLPALPAVLPLLGSDDELTRLRAQRVFERATRAWLRERTPDRSTARAADYAWMKLWHDNGDYNWDGPAEVRAAAIDRWRAWLGSQGITGQ
jgi:hypothetical protein